MLGSAERGKVTLIAVKLISKNSSLYDHDTSTLQTDGQMDGQLGSAIPRYFMLRAVKTLYSENSDLEQRHRHVPFLPPPKKKKIREQKYFWAIIM